jgi:hypothetical protein
MSVVYVLMTTNMNESSSDAIAVVLSTAEAEAWASSKVDADTSRWYQHVPVWGMGDLRDWLKETATSEVV